MKPYLGIWHPFDKLYPTDVHDNSYYGKYDFIWFDGASLDYQIVAGKEFYKIKGHIKGWGYNIFNTNTKIVKIAAGIGLGVDVDFWNMGYYTGKKFPSPFNYAGNGQVGGFDLDVYVGSIGYLWWKSFDKNKNVIWEGSQFTIGVGIGAKAFEGNQIETKLVYPPDKKTFNIKKLEKDWNNNLKYKNYLPPIFN
jgi:hypothetical protein